MTQSMSSWLACRWPRSLSRSVGGSEAARPRGSDEDEREEEEDEEEEGRGEMSAGWLHACRSRSSIVRMVM